MIARRALVALALTLTGWLCALASPTAASDVNCDDFSSASDAQAYYEEDRSDPADLDRDGDGYACEWGPVPPEEFLNDANQSAHNDSGIPMWVWLGGGIGLLWIAGLTRASRL